MEQFLAEHQSKGFEMTEENVDQLVFPKDPFSAK